jgi:hypothetical protein
LDIYIDTTYIASHSFSYLSLESGRYTLYAYEPNNLEWKPNSIKKQIEIIKGEHLQIDLSDFESVRIYSKPYNSYVYSNNILMGRTPLILQTSKAQDQSLTIKKEGFNDYAFSLTDNQKQYMIELNRLDNYEHLTVLKSGAENNHFRWYREGLIVTSVVSSWASFFFKKRADLNYNRYLRTAEPVQMVTSFRRTQDFDRYAEIALGVSLVSLGIYFFILIID